MKHNLIRLVALMLAAMMLLCFVGCGADETIDANVSSVLADSSEETSSENLESQEESSSEEESSESEDDETSSKKTSSKKTSSKKTSSKKTSSKKTSSKKTSSKKTSSKKTSSKKTSSKKTSSKKTSSKVSSEELLSSIIEENYDDVTSEDSVSDDTSSEEEDIVDETSSEEESDEEPEEEYEKPNAGNDTILFNKQTSKYDAQADSMRQEIINAKDSDLKGSKTYYVSYKGSDYNSGTSPDSPWKTINKVNSSSMPSNSVVLFERGGVYRGSLDLKSNTSYGAYGTGSKPCIYGSKKNYADESLWKKSTKRKGTWEIAVDEKDVGQIVFDHGVQVATKVPKGATKAEEYNYVFSGGKLYLYISDNPAKLYDSIEISGFDHVLHANREQNITIENLCIKYGGKHGMSFSEVENVTVKNCEVGYIGGVGSQVPLGNGIEFWLGTKNVTVENCWVYQCFDAGITNQGQGAKHVQEDITYKNNLIEYCIYGIEYFAKGSEGSVIKDTLYTGNMIRFSGMGWSKPLTRVKETWKKSAVSAINGWASNKGVGDFVATNFVIENNILDTSWKYLISLIEPNAPDRVIVRKNTYYQKSSDTACIWLDDQDKVVQVESESQMKEEIAKIDSNPKSVQLD